MLWSGIYKPLEIVLSVMPSGNDGIQLAWKPSLASGFRQAAQIPYLLAALPPSLVVVHAGMTGYLNNCLKITY
jgi:hypothetical protein